MLWQLSIASVTLFLSSGCTTVVRENIISSINTGIGVSLAENPKTELYEVKVGYIRNQFYSVPTGKMVKGATNNAADVTPELVSGIRMNSDARHLFLGITVAENFAVGKTAVMSPAAVAMYVSEARSPEAATAASSAASTVAASVKTIIEPPEDVIAEMDPLTKAYNALHTNPEKKRVFDDAAKTEGYTDFRSMIMGNPKYPSVEQVAKIRLLLEKDSDIKSKLN